MSLSPISSALSGRVCLQPGAPLPNIQSTRPDLAARLTTGRAAQDIPDLLASLFALCGHAHRFTARRALAAASGQAAEAKPDEYRTLQASTAREQVMRIVHDWPKLLPSLAKPQAEVSAEGLRGLPAPSPAEHLLHAAQVTQLRSNPLWRPDLSTADQIAALPAWLEHHWLGMPVATWLQRFETEPETWPLHWAAQAHSAVALTLHSHGPAAECLATASEPSTLLAAPEQSMPWLSQHMANEPGFCQQPHWHGAVPDSGPWNREHCPLKLPTHHAAMRLAARIVEVLRLALPSGAQWLAHGALALGPREGVAWTEMARGLLIHWVRLDENTTRPRAEAYRVLAPTEWNFHPRGVLARALSGLRGPQATADAARLAVAFDPCVEFVVQPAQATRPEAQHA